MTFIRVSLLALILTWPCFTTANADVDGSAVQTFKGGGAVAPASTAQSIRLVSEEAVFRLRSRTYRADLVFKLFNAGETTTQWIGFPMWIASREKPYSILIKLEGVINGTPMKFSEESSADCITGFPRNISFCEKRGYACRPRKQERHWLVSRVTFPGYARTTIRLRYEAPYYGEGVRRVSYMYGTGSLWDGNIRKAAFIVDSTEVGGTQRISIAFRKGLGGKHSSEIVKPQQPRLLLENTIRYDMGDFKPHLQSHLTITLTQAMGMTPRHVVPKDCLPIRPPNLPFNFGLP